jgi:hypothetical protein
VDYEHVIASVSAGDAVEGVVVVAAVVSALAAVLAARYANHSIRETHALRREDRLARLPELVAEIAEDALTLPAGHLHANRVYPIKRHRLVAALAALDDPLPACREIASGERFEKAGALELDYVSKRAREAMEELAELLRRAR